jgi:hypothetical protein
MYPGRNKQGKSVGLISTIGTADPSHNKLNKSTLKWICSGARVLGCNDYDPGGALYAVLGRVL